MSTLVGCNNEPSMTFKEEDSYYLYQNYKYGPAVNRRNLMDVAIPKNVTTSGLVLYIHGGGWVSGDKTINYNDYKKYLDKGLAFAAINYRYAADKVHNQDIMDDITLSLSKIKELAKEYNIDLEKAALFGGSAGAHLSLQYSYTQREVAPIKPAVAMSLSGPTDLLDEYYYDKDGKYAKAYMDMFTKLSGTSITLNNWKDKADYLKAVSPLYQVNKKEDAVPTIIAHGGKDDVVPLSNAISLKDRLNEVGQKVDYFYLPNSGHGLESDPDISTQYWNCFDKYLDDYVL